MARLFSTDMTRMVDDEPPLAFAAYELRLLDDEHGEGNHVGIFNRRADAESWVRTGTPEPFKIRVVT